MHRLACRGRCRSSTQRRAPPASRPMPPSTCSPCSPLKRCARALPREMHWSLVMRLYTVHVSRSWHRQHMSNGVVGYPTTPVRVCLDHCLAVSNVLPCRSGCGGCGHPVSLLTREERPTMAVRPGALGGRRGEPGGGGGGGVRGGRCGAGRRVAARARALPAAACQPAAGGLAMLLGFALCTGL